VLAFQLNVAALVDGAVTVRVTGTDFVVAPEAATVIVPFKVPAASPAVFTATVAVPVPEPEAGLIVSQGALSLADQLRVPPPVFAMLNACAAGFAPPALAVKVKLIGLSPIAGVVLPEVTVRVTGTDFAVAPVAATVIVAL
jgi:hypothetical protein